MKGVARFAAVVVERAGELASMDVRVAPNTRRQFYLVDGHRTRGYVALRAGDIDVLSFQRVSSAGMLAHTERAGFEPIYRVASGALAAILARDELALVLVSVAVQTTGESQRPVEIRSFVAGITAHLTMFAHQRVLGLGVVECGANLDLRNLLPRGGCMAGLAGSFECTMMGVGMAIGASAEGHPCESHHLRVRGLPLVALLAGDLRMCPLKREPCARVVEMRHLPVVKNVAASAVIAEMASVRVYVTGETVPRQP